MLNSHHEVDLMHILSLTSCKNPTSLSISIDHHFKMSRPVPRIEYEEFHESATDKLKRKALADPYVPVGILGFCGALAWGAYSYKSRGNTSTSIFLMRLRVVAQTCVVGAMAVGAGIAMIKRSSSEKET